MKKITISELRQISVEELQNGEFIVSKKDLGANTETELCKIIGVNVKQKVEAKKIVDDPRTTYHKF